MKKNRDFRVIKVITGKDQEGRENRKDEGKFR